MLYSPVMLLVLLGLGLIELSSNASVSNSTSQGKTYQVTFFSVVPSQKVKALLLAPKSYRLSEHKWDKTTLTYCTRNYPGSNSQLTTYQVDQIMRDSFKYWSDVSCLTFVNNCAVEADMEMSFHYGAHGDNTPFDGAGQKLAHGFYPTDDASQDVNGKIGGDVHFDNSENFQAGSDSGINLKYVATHEIGHALGIDHSEFTDAVMFPDYSGGKADFTLSQDDINAIRKLYGACDVTTTTTTTPAPASANEMPAWLRFWMSFFG